MERPARSDAPAGGEARGEAGDAVRAAGPRVVYCGGCNPHIDRGAVASELAAAPAFMRPGAIVYLSGCQRACASGHQLALAGEAGRAAVREGAADTEVPAVVVAGADVDGTPTPTGAIAATVIDKLKE